MVRALASLDPGLGLVSKTVVIYPGNPNNFVTRQGSIESFLFSPLGGLCPPRPPELSRDFVLFQVPRYEGRSPLWRPVTLGHELGHVPAALPAARASIGQLMNQVIDANVAGTLQLPFQHLPPGVVGVASVVGGWFTELLCDAVALLRYGPAGVASLAEYFDVAGANDAGASHPPKWLRLECLFGWLGGIPAELEPIVEPFRGLAAPPPLQAWESFVVDAVRNAAPGLLALASTWTPAPYDFHAKAATISDLGVLLARGVPCGQLYDSGGSRVEVAEADVVNACWLVRSDPGLATPPTEALAAKALSDLEFLETWEGAGGQLLHQLPDGGPPAATPAAGVLHFSELASRLRRPAPGCIGVSPLLPDAISGAAIDLRLGRSFIVFARSGTSSFDPLDEVDATALQRSVELDWGRSLVLHPNELVLAATLEYITLPVDLAAQVITRSSFGRLGLLSATAVQVHPGFRGCLTLELANLSNVPLHLTPGQRIAQLVVSHVDGTPSGAAVPKYDCPTGPQFSRVGTDPESAVLRNLRPTQP